MVPVIIISIIFSEFLFVLTKCSVKAKATYLETSMAAHFGRDEEMLEIVPISNIVAMAAC